MMCADWRTLAASRTFVYGDTCRSLFYGLLQTFIQNTILAKRHMSPQLESVHSLYHVVQAHSLPSNSFGIVLECFGSNKISAKSGNDLVRNEFEIQALD